ncbi:hypothetical protein HHK36_010224 [Tetracentron sinense]|uniref:Uncharacterized protein n=1 Tax=Tetracentron sinense TaxID=13715 RepID=A0A834ZDX3_TETSI|nr:hypothetical protein HHK36_010224 [Tetracentron sinense]
MAVEGDVWQGFVSSIVLNSKESNQNGDMLSPEDAAWVDSCLVKDPELSPELSEGSWNSLKDALLDIISLQAGSHFDSLAAERDGVPRGNDIGLPTSEEARSAQYMDITADDLFPDITADDLFPVSEEPEIAKFPVQQTDDGLLPISEKEHTENFQSYLRKGFLLNPLDLKENDESDVGVDLGFTNEMESSPEDIFRVWDLDTPPVVEDELVHELKKAIEESSFRGVTSNHDDSCAQADWNEETLDELIGGISDLSLHRSSG